MRSKGIFGVACVWMAMSLAVSVAAQRERTAEYEGTVNGVLPIHATIIQVEDRINGSYYYEKYKKTLRLEGMIEEDQTNRIKEFDDTGKQTGLFVLRIGPQGLLQGTWSRPDGSNAMPVKLKLLSVKARDLDDKWTGAYESENGTLEVLKTSPDSIRFRLLVVMGPTAHTGEATGELAVKDGKAAYRKGSCVLTLSLYGNRVVIEQSGTDADCDFGMDVTAGGTYRFKNSAPPKF